MSSIVSMSSGESSSYSVTPAQPIDEILKTKNFDLSRLIAHGLFQSGAEASNIADEQLPYVERIANEIKKYSGNIDQTSIGVLTAIENVHWAAVGFFVVAAVSKNVDAGTIENNECFKFMKDLSEVILQLQDLPDSEMELHTELNESIRLIVKGAILCCSLNERAYEALGDEQELQHLIRNIKDKCKILRLQKTISALRGVQSNSIVSPQPIPTFNKDAVSSPTMASGDSVVEIDECQQAAVNDEESNLSPDICIFKIDKDFRPERIGLGFFHHEHSSDRVQKIKEEALMAVTRIGGIDEKNLVEHVRWLDRRIKDCYGVSDEITPKNFALDACFIVQIFTDDKLRKKLGNDYKMEDIFTFQNQIPLFLLLEMLKLKHKNSEEAAVEEFARGLTKYLPFQTLFPFHRSSCEEHLKKGIIEELKHVKKEGIEKLKGLTKYLTFQTLFPFHRSSCDELLKKEETSKLKELLKKEETDKLKELLKEQETEKLKELLKKQGTEKLKEKLKELLKKQEREKCHHLLHLLIKSIKDFLSPNDLGTLAGMTAGQKCNYFHYKECKDCPFKECNHILGKLHHYMKFKARNGGVLFEKGWLGSSILHFPKITLDEAAMRLHMNLMQAEPSSDGKFICDLIYLMTCIVKEENEGVFREEGIILGNGKKFHKRIFKLNGANNNFGGYIEIIDQIEGHCKIAYNRRIHKVHEFFSRYGHYVLPSLMAVIAIIFGVLQYTKKK